MNDADCVAFLQWALPRLGLAWSGMRKVRRQVCKRIGRRMRELGVADANAYRLHLESSPGEWGALARLCTITISRFYRDREVFDQLASIVLPALSEGALASGCDTLECWSAGCASGEEPYTVAILWAMELAPRFPGLRLQVLGTDIDETLLERASRGCYGQSSVSELPPEWRERAFELRDARPCIRDALRIPVAFERQDLLARLPEARFHLVLCRNLAFTYFDAARAAEALARIASRLRPDGALVIGIHERLPDDTGFEPWPGCRATFRRVS